MTGLGGSRPDIAGAKGWAGFYLYYYCYDACNNVCYCAFIKCCVTMNFNTQHLQIK